jgi:hypothetical protein
MFAAGFLTAVFIGAVVFIIAAHLDEEDDE